ncbi:MAG: tetratricopeptide repeat protein [Gammaproteobacteria bacterium]|nr:tetratricopeptide repeat protein [Gammaproteobacteria bacterium]
MTDKTTVAELVSGRAFNRLVESLPIKWQQLTPYMRLYATFLILAGLVFQLCYPITLTDSDMWYHMDGGRWFWEHMSIPDTAFFSFLEPERSFVNYYWGFQALVAKVFQHGEYYGLLLLRATLFFLTTLVAYRYIIEEKNTDRSLLPFLILFIAYFVFIEGRVPNLRPHLFSHLFILLFLYILERRPAWSPALPLITAAWANLHGIEYPVPALIGGAYFLEFLHNRYVRKTPDTDRSWSYAIWILACAPALLATPAGIELLLSPFNIAPHAGLYIKEMKHLDSRMLYSFFLSGDTLKLESVFSLTFLFCSFALLRSLLDRTLRLSHALIAAGGYLLLLKGNRFLWEWSLLVLPAMTHYIGNMKPLGNGRRIISISGLLILVIMALPLVSMVKRLPVNAPYPHDTRNEPTGVLRFLEQAGNGGHLLTSPSKAGYIHWKLYPDYKVYIDLQMSLFTDFDIYTALQMYRNKTVLANILTKLKPDYLMVSKKNKEFPELIKKHPDFVPVFLDDRQVLYANRVQQPVLVEQYQLKLVNPFSLLEVNDEVELGDHVEELERILEVFPESERVNHSITRLLFNARRYAEALPWARRYAEYHPDNPNSHYLLGNIHENSGACEKAIELYEIAMAFSDRKFKRTLNTHIGSCYYILGDFSKAYDHLWNGINPYTRSVRDEDLYQLAFSAYIVGETQEAILLLRILLQSDSLEAQPMFSDANELLRKLEEGDAETPSFLEWSVNQAISLFSFGKE